MIKKSLFFAILLVMSSSTFADSQSFGPIIQRQSKQIQELKAKVLELENTVDEIQISLKKSGFVYNQTDKTPVQSIQPLIGEAAANSLLSSEEDNTFFGNNEKTSEPSDKIDYDLALATLKDGGFDLAEHKFADFIKKHPTSRLQSNATFWYAETFYRRGLYNKAAINYLQSYKQYPNGSKAPDALLKLSYSLASLNKNKEACSMLEKLELEFPKRPIASIKRAQEAAEKFRCKQ